MLERAIRGAFGIAGYDILPRCASDTEQQFQDIYKKCKEYTVTTGERMYALYKALQYIVDNRIPGDIVECGVWKGGSMMLCAMMLKALGDTQRNLYLYDTYAGMSEPTDKDIDYKGRMATALWNRIQRNGSNAWWVASLDEVKNVMYSTG